MNMKSPKLLAAAIAGLALLPFTSSQALVVVLSGGTDANGTANLNQLESFLTSNFTNVTEVRKGNFANFTAAATQTALTGADLVIIGRTLASGDYQNGNATGYNSLAKPVIALTSYVARQDTTRLGWHAGGASQNLASSLVAGSETTVTAEGATVFNLTAGNYDFFANNGGGNFNGLGEGSLGGGDLLATLDGRIVAARWDAGDAPGNPATAGVATFPAARLLFNLDNDPVDGSPTGSPTNDLATLTATGRAALIASFASMGLTPVPEPSAALLVLASVFGLGASRRRRS